MAEIIFEVIGSDVRDFEARVLGHSIFPQGEDWNELKRRYEKPCNAISARPPRPGAMLSSGLALEVRTALLQIRSDFRYDLRLLSLHDTLRHLRSPFP